VIQLVFQTRIRQGIGSFIILFGEPCPHAFRLVSKIIPTTSSVWPPRVTTMSLVSNSRGHTTRFAPVRFTCFKNGVFLTNSF
jgi:hypothetical protein